MAGNSIDELEVFDELSRRQDSLEEAFKTFAQWAAITISHNAGVPHMIAAADLEQLADEAAKQATAGTEQDAEPNPLLLWLAHELRSLPEGGSAGMFGASDGGKHGSN
ncbi:hypothetical protein [Alteripontixanthobacter muriae]|uniref:hypothetical protein n=1 Tax=Alteripontixanthobacter muriae TaxID=2705546 RepID=UPI00157565FD|nr:hypothetical protein [Alteripontixanthobacter muriae]